MSENEQDLKVKRLVKELRTFHHLESAKELERLWSIVSRNGVDKPMFTKVRALDVGDPDLEGFPK